MAQRENVVVGQCRSMSVKKQDAGKNENEESRRPVQTLVQTDMQE